MTTDVNEKRTEDLASITDDNGRTFIRRTFDARFVIHKIEIIRGLRREHDSASLKFQKSIIGVLSASEKGLAVIGRDENYYLDKPIKLLITGQEEMKGLFEAIREAKGFTSESSLYAKRAYEVKNPDELSVADIWFTDADHRYGWEPEWNCHVTVSNTMLDKITDMFRETELDAASITITINAFIDQAGYYRPFPERRYWYVPPGEQGSEKVCGTVDSITLIEPKHLLKAGEDAHNEPESIDDQPQAAEAEIARPVPILDPEFMKMLRHVKRYLLCIAIALAAIAVVMLFR